MITDRQLLRAHAELAMPFPWEANADSAPYFEVMTFKAAVTPAVIIGLLNDLAAQKEAVESLTLAEEGAKVAFSHVVQKTRDLERQIEHMNGNLQSAYAYIKKLTRQDAAAPKDAP